MGQSESKTEEIMVSKSAENVSNEDIKEGDSFTQSLLNGVIVLIEQFNLDFLRMKCFFSLKMNWK
jgi:hypothetical protein